MVMLEGTAGDHLLVQTPAQSRLNCSRLLKILPNVFSTSPRMETSPPLWASAQSPSKQNKVFLIFKWNVFVSIASSSDTGYHWEEPGSIFNTPSFIYIDMIPFSLVLYRPNCSSQRFSIPDMFQSFNHLYGPLLVNPVCPHLLLYWADQNCRHVLPVLIREERTPP